MTSAPRHRSPADNKQHGRDRAIQLMNQAVAELQGEPAYAELLSSFRDATRRMFERDPIS